jgi:hypothetical protein
MEKNVSGAKSSFGVASLFLVFAAGSARARQGLQPDVARINAVTQIASAEAELAARSRGTPSRADLQQASHNPAENWR